MLYFYDISLDDSDSVCHIQSIEILAQSHIALFESSWRNKSVDLFTFNVVEFLDSRLDLTLVGLNIYNEHKSIAVLNEFHGRFRRQGVLDDGILVDSRLLWGTAANILGLALQRLSLGPVKVNLCVNTSSLFGNALLERL